MDTRRAAASDSYALPTTSIAQRRPEQPFDRFQMTVHSAESRYAALLDDVRRGLRADPKWLPPKYFYDDRGAQLFDTICDLPEYYLTRTEDALLRQAADEVVALTRPAEVIEFGSGASRKTRVLLDALEAAPCDVCYIPIDVSEGMLRESALALLPIYPRLHVHAIVADYERHLDAIPHGHQRLVLFLGSTIGNLTPAATAQFLASLRRQLVAGDHLLMGADLVKSVDVLEAAYNDSAGVTAAFNRNILRVLNTQLGANFELDDFDHVAFFNPARAQIEMHLRARRSHTVTIPRLGTTVPFIAGETIHTEISRKFTADQVRETLAAAAFELVRWYTPSNHYFGVALARAV